MAVFNREDGDLAMGSKTPISILQEILHKKGLIPQYELIYNGQGLPVPIYKFQVTAVNMSAIGEGKTKKEAKHDAAATLLKKLLTPVADKHSEEVDIASPYTGSIKTNYVGKLDDICALNKIPFANYVLVTEEGPPHARIFTMKCNLARFSEVAVARTKKQAKHLVAQKMIDRVEKMLKDRFIPALEIEEPPVEVESDLEKIRNGTFHHDLSLEVKNLHNVFHLRKDEVPLPPIFLGLPDKPEEFYESVEKPMECLEEVVAALEGIVKRIPFIREDIKTDLNRMVDLFEDDLFNSEEEYEEIGNEGGEIDNVISALPDFPLPGEEENEKQPVSSITENQLEECVERVRNIDIVDNFLPVYSFIEVETPLGLWDFIGEGRNDEEAFEQAVRQALIFLRTMAIRPPNVK